MSKTIQALETKEWFDLRAATMDLAHAAGSRHRRIRDALMIMLMGDTGIRVGEMVQLRQVDVYMNEAPVHTLHIREEISKSKAGRMVPLNTSILWLLNAMRSSLRNRGCLRTTSFIFVTNDSEKNITVRQVERIVAKISYAAIGRTIHPHVLRHTFATRAMRVASTRVVQQLLGHKSLTSTQVYTHPNSTDLTDAIEKMDNEHEVPKK